MTDDATEAGIAPLGERMHDFIADLFPICRSLTGNGVRETLRAIEARVAPAVMTWTEVPTGTKVLDWEIPDEWNLHEAYIEDSNGRRVVDTAISNLHVMSYSEPIDITLDLAELDAHLHSLPDRPHAIPYRTSYYARRWGFCLSDQQRRSLAPGRYRAVVDATLEPGSLTYGEVVLPGTSDREILIVSHVCHPSLCNDNLAGVSVAVELLRELSQRSTLTHTFRFLFSPVTLGAIAWLSREREGGGAVERIAHGLVLTGLGDPSAFTYKRSRRGTASIDAAVEHVLSHGNQLHRTIEFGPYGYDERQFCSPGFNLPVGRLCRATHGEHAEYHTSDDNLSFVTPPSLAESLRVVTEIIEVLEGDATYVNTEPYGEPRLGPRGLFHNLGGVVPPSTEMALLWILNQSDATNSLLDIATKAGLPFAEVRRAADALVDVGLLRCC
jgi:aminopeptidase-like protein